jgi:hypothetical protein
MRIICHSAIFSGVVVIKNVYFTGESLKKIKTFFPIFVK